MSPNRLHFLKLNTSGHFYIMSGVKIQISINIRPAPHFHLFYPAHITLVCYAGPNRRIWGTGQTFTLPTRILTNIHCVPILLVPCCHQAIEGDMARHYWCVFHHIVLLWAVISPPDWGIGHAHRKFSIFKMLQE